MTLPKTAELGPVEVRTRQRRRRHMIYLGIALLIGGTIGGVTGFFGQGDGNLFGGVSVLVGDQVGAELYAPSCSLLTTCRLSYRPWQ